MDGCKKFKDFYSDNKLQFISLRVSLEQGAHTNHSKTLGFRLYIVKTPAVIQVTGNKKKNPKDWSQHRFVPAELSDMFWGRFRAAEFQLRLKSFISFIVRLRRTCFFKICLRFLQVFLINCQKKIIKYEVKNFWLHKISFSLLQSPMIPRIWIRYYNSVISKKISMLVQRWKAGKEKGWWNVCWRIQ